MAILTTSNSDRHGCLEGLSGGADIGAVVKFLELSVQ